MTKSNLVPIVGGRTARAKASRMREMVLSLVNGMGDMRDMPMAFMALRPFIPILEAKLREMDDSLFLALLDTFEAKLHYVKTGDSLQ